MKDTPEKNEFIDVLEPVHTQNGSSASSRGTTNPIQNPDHKAPVPSGKRKRPRILHLARSEVPVFEYSLFCYVLIVYHSYPSPFPTPGDEKAANSLSLLSHLHLNKSYLPIIVSKIILAAV